MFLVFNLPLPLPKNHSIQCCAKILRKFFSICFPALLHNVHVVSLIKSIHKTINNFTLLTARLDNVFVSDSLGFSWHQLKIFCLEKISYCEAIYSIYESLTTSTAIFFNSRNRFLELCMQFWKYMH